MNKYRDEAHYNIFDKFNPELIEKKYILRKDISKKYDEDLWDNYFKDTSEYLKEAHVEEADIPFLELVSKLILKTFDTGFDEENSNLNDLQFILTGSPSAGKTTELKRIAHKLIQEDNRIIVHFCSLQNTVTKEIKDSSQMWDKIMQSHISSTWAHDRYTIDEFEKLHKENRLKPIFLIDTLDIITLNNNTDNKFSKAWNQFLKEAHKKKFRILWTSRKVEKEMLEMDISKEDFPKEIRLPALEPNLLSKERLAKSTKNLDEKTFWILLQMAFPIFVGFDKKDISNSLNLSKIWTSNILDTWELTKRNRTWRDYTDKNAGPLRWIIEIMERKLPTDVLFDTYVEEIRDYVDRRYGVQNDDFNKIWEDLEIEFFHSALNRRSGSRIIINQRDLEKDENLNAILRYASEIGLIKRYANNNIEFVHQLFAEYCVWKHGKDLPEFDRKILLLPSCFLRKIGTSNTEIKNIIENHEIYYWNVVKEGIEWYTPFILTNVSLAKVEPSEYQKYTVEWKNAIHRAMWVVNNYSTSTFTENVTNNLRRLNDEKEKIISSMDNDKPLIISGPPGVGKSHLAHIFFDKRGNEILGKHFERLKENEERKFDQGNYMIPKAHFITLSPKLSNEIKERVEDYYLGSTKPAEIKSWNIQDFLMVLGSKLELELKVTLNFKRFCSRLREFERQRREKFTKFSKQSLWKEYEKMVITRNGKRRSKEEYKKSFPEYLRLFDNQSCEKWYEFVKHIPREEKTLSEISNLAIRKICEIYKEGTLEEREAIKVLESDILVIDEIQDLSVPIIMLLLILHRKPVRNVMIAGDEEQAMAFEGFKWKKIFSGVNAELNKLDDEFKIKETKKWKDLKHYVEDTKYLIYVERNVPPIVDVIKESWNNFDAGLDIIKDELNKEKRDDEKRGIKRGTKNVEHGELSAEEYEKKRKEERPTGVRILKSLKNKTDAISLAKTIYDSNDDIAIIVTDENTKEEFSKELEKNNIEIPIWNPEDVKGLEYPQSVVIDPWSISLLTFQESISLPKSNDGSSISSWDQFLDWFEKIKHNEAQKHKRDEIINTIKSKRRHSNVTLSRAKELLIITESLELSDTIRIPKPKLDGLTDIPDNGVVEIEDKKNTDRDNFSEMVFGAELNQESSGIVRLIERLVKIILTSDNYADNKNAIQKQSGHILHKLEFQTPLPIIILNKYDYDDKSNFILNELINEYNKEYNYFETLFSAISKESKAMKKEELKKFILETNKDNFKEFLENKKLGGLYDESIKFTFINNNAWASFIDEFNQFKKKCFIKYNKTNIDSINVPINYYSNYLKNWDSQLKKLSTIDEKTWKNLSMDSEKQIFNLNWVLMKYVIENFLGRYKEYNLPEKTFERWFENLEILNLDSYTLEFKPIYDKEDIIQLIANQASNSAKESNDEGLNDKEINIEEKEINDFWKQGIKYIEDGKLSLEKLRKCTNLIQDIKKTNIKLNLHLYEFLALAISEKINLNEENIDSGIDFEIDIIDKLIDLKNIKERFPTKDLEISKLIKEKHKFKLVNSIINFDEEKRENLIKSNPLNLRKLILNCFKEHERLLEDSIKDRLKIETLMKFGEMFFKIENSNEFLTNFQKIINLKVYKSKENDLNKVENYEDKIFGLELKDNPFAKQILNNLDKKAKNKIITRNLRYSWVDWDKKWGTETERDRLREVANQVITNVLLELGEDLISKDKAFCESLINVVGPLAEPSEDHFLDIDFLNEQKAWNWLDYITEIISKYKRKNDSDIIWNETLLNKKRKELNIFVKLHESEEISDIHNRVRNYFALKQNKFTHLERMKIMEYESSLMERENHPKDIVVNDFNESIRLIYFLTMTRTNILSQIRETDNYLMEWKGKHNEHKQIVTEIKKRVAPSILEKLAETLILSKVNKANNEKIRKNIRQEFEGIEKAKVSEIMTAIKHFESKKSDLLVIAKYFSQRNVKTLLEEIGTYFCSQVGKYKHFKTLGNEFFKFAIYNKLSIKEKRKISEDINLWDHLFPKNYSYFGYKTIDAKKSFIKYLLKIGRKSVKINEVVKISNEDELDNFRIDLPNSMTDIKLNNFHEEYLLYHIDLDF
ncbi:MAG: hypothetical protein CMB48_01545 [Euryarchaeota archaeon]|nr:hypothetical protein [Euryarchaeota archaeon]